MIFNLFKSKPSLKELIPKGFVDIHSHILPGIDDGAKNSEESLKLISEMKKLGFSKIIGTPHSYPGLYDNTSDSIKNAFKKLENLGIEDIKLDYATEYMIDISLIGKAENKNLLCLHNNYVLLEMGFINAPQNLFDIIFNIQLNGYKIIIAHPERYLFYNSNFNELKKIKQRGCKFQMNLLSTTGYYGKEVLNFSNKLLKNNMIDFFASDIHNINHVNQFENKLKINQTKRLDFIIENSKEFN